MSDRSFRFLDENFNSLLESIHAKTDTLKTPGLRDRRRKKADISDEEFCRIYYPGIFESEFNALHHEVASWESGNHTLTGFPTSGKSAFVYVAKIIKPLAIGNLNGVVNISLRTQDLANMRSFQIYQLITSNDLLMYDYNIQVQTEKIGSYEINHTWFIATSYRMGLRSYSTTNFKRFMICVNDDLYNRESVSSEKDNDKVKRFVVNESWRMMERDGLNITIGNVIEPDDPLDLINQEFPGIHYGLAIQDEEGNSNWPERWSVEEIQEKKAGTSYLTWKSEWELKRELHGEVMNPAWLREVNINTIEIVASLSAIDPSRGKSDGASYRAIATLGADSKGYPHLLDIYIRKESWTELFNYAGELRSSIPHHKVFAFENDFAQWDFAELYYRDWLAKPNIPLALWQYVTSDLLEGDNSRGQDKESRMFSLVYPHQAGQFKYAEGLLNTPDGKIYRSQYLALGTKTEQMDGLDAVAAAYILLPRYIVTGGFKSIKKRSWPKRAFGRLH